MVHVRKEQPGSAPGGHVWSHPGDVIEMLDEKLAAEIVRIKDAGFSLVHPEAEAQSKPETQTPEHEPPAETAPDGQPGSAPAAPGRQSKS